MILLGFCGYRYRNLIFERDAFREMIRHIEEGSINCVIVKDFSRLGRDHIETGKYIERYFAGKKVRFIAVNEGYDSLKADMNDANNSLIVPFKNIINEAFLEDISVKTKTQLEIKRKNGEFVGNFTVYGYLKTDNKKMIPDDYAADIVRDIFQMKLGGYNEQQIADFLNARGILPPAAYKKSLGIAYKTPFAVKDRPLWSVNAVKRILTNRAYIGHLEQGKRTKASYRMKKCSYRPQDEWIIHEYDHEPLVAESDFEIVQKLMAQDTRVSKSGKLHPFSGILICGGCGRPMILRTLRKNGKEYINFICSTHKKTGDCNYNNVSARTIEQFALASIRAQIAGLISASEIDNDFGSQSLQGRKQSAIEGMIDKNLHVIEENKNYLVKACEHFLSGSISENEYSMFKSSFYKQIEAAESNIAALHGELINLGDRERNKTLVAQFRQYENIEALDRSAVVNLIDSITVYDSRNMRLCFRYMSELDALLDIDVMLERAVV